MSTPDPEATQAAVRAALESREYYEAKPHKAYADLMAVLGILDGERAPDPEAPIECPHSGPTEKKFGGAIICGHCRLVIGHWKPSQPTAHLNRKDYPNA